MSEQITLEAGTLKGVTEPTIKKIVDAGVSTVGALARQIPNDLAERAGIGKDTAEKAISKALELIDVGFIDGLTLYEQRKDRTLLTTGSKALDELLGGGIQSTTTTEFSGREGSGKTQICHTLAVLAQQPVDDGGLDGDVVWIDTEGTFMPERIMQIAEARGYDPDITLSRIQHGQAHTSIHQRALIEQLDGICHSRNIKLIIVDSMMAHLRAEYLGRGTLAERQNVLNDMLQKLAKTCQTYKITAIYTNQVMDNPAIMYGNPEKAVGGHIMGHAATTRIQIRKGKDNKRVFKLDKSPYLPEGEAVIVITEKGIEDEGNE